MKGYRRERRFTYSMDIDVDGGGEEGKERTQYPHCTTIVRGCGSHVKSM